MILGDVGVLLSAMAERSPHHEPCRRALETLRKRPADLAINDLILSSVVRIGTNPRIWKPSPSPDRVFEFVDSLRVSLSPRVNPGPRHWTIFRDLVLGLDIRGSDVTDAYLAALAIESGCEWWTTDRGFARFTGLRWRNLAD